MASIRMMVYFLLKSAPYIKVNFRSSIGPKIKNAIFDVRGNEVKDEATNASASEHMEKTKANRIIVILAINPWLPRDISTLRGTNVLINAEIKAPKIRYLLIYKKSS